MALTTMVAMTRQATKMLLMATAPSNTTIVMA